MRSFLWFVVGAMTSFIFMSWSIKIFFKKCLIGNFNQMKDANNNAMFGVEFYTKNPNELKDILSKLNYVVFKVKK